MDAYFPDIEVRKQWPSLVSAPRITYVSGEVKVRVVANSHVSVSFGPHVGEVRWMPLPEDTPTAEAMHDDITYYQTVRTRNNVYVPVPRTTRCYGQSYAYAGVAHPLHDQGRVPKWLERMMRATDTILGYRAGTINTCLVNHYTHGYHCIGAHSDDTHQLVTPDVVCWVFGAARRSLIIADRVTGRELAEINMPSGIYAMCGTHFQRKLTHAIPRLHDSLFKSLRQRVRWGADANTTLDDTLDGAPTLPLGTRIANWMRRKAAYVHANVCKTNEERVKFIDWCKPRRSYTFRAFAQAK